MREILFRGKRVDNGKWECGFHVMYSRSIAHPYSYTDGDHYIQTVPHNMKFKVDPDTVCQYTGLRDKNGKKIFEGDIISTPKYGIDNGKGQNYSGKDRFVVGYADGTYHLENDWRKFCLRPDSTCEVVGNIFDNPELMETDYE